MQAQANQFLNIIATFSSIAISLTAILAFLSAFFKPIRNFVLWVYKKFTGNRDKNAEMMDKIDGLQTRLSEEIENVRTDLTEKIKAVSDSNDKYEMKRLRWEILDFANSCKNKRKHTQDEYRHIIEVHDDYEKLLSSTGEENGFLDAEFDYILKLYAERQEQNDFL